MNIAKSKRKERKKKKKKKHSTKSTREKEESLENPERLARFINRHFQNTGKIGVYNVQYRKDEIFELIDLARQSLKSQETLISIESPVKIVGDIHGQFNDLLLIINTLGTPPESRYLFLGDYVDRGRQSLECILLLLAYKVLYPKHVFLLRGNHECKSINEYYGFMEECQRRFKTKTIWKLFQTAFDELPISALINHQILCMHGGLSPNLATLTQLRNIKRPIVDPGEDEQVINDLLWADPEVGITGWHNSPRKTSFVFGADVVDQYCQILNLNLIVRAHQVCQDGFRFFANQKLVTIFSAPNYCGDNENCGAVLEVGADMGCKFKIFKPNKPT